MCVCACFKGAIFSWVFSSTDNDGLINELPTLSLTLFHPLLFENDEYTVENETSMPYHISYEYERLLQAQVIKYKLIKHAIVIRFPWKTGDLFAR